MFPLFFILSLSLQNELEDYSNGTDADYVICDHKKCYGKCFHYKSTLEDGSKYDGEECYPEFEYFLCATPYYGYFAAVGAFIVPGIFVSLLVFLFKRRFVGWGNFLISISSGVLCGAIITSGFCVRYDYTLSAAAFILSVGSLIFLCLRLYSCCHRKMKTANDVREKYYENVIKYNDNPQSVFANDDDIDRQRSEMTYEIIPYDTLLHLHEQNICGPPKPKVTIVYYDIHIDEDKDTGERTKTEIYQEHFSIDVPYGSWSLQTDENIQELCLKKKKTICYTFISDLEYNYNDDTLLQKRNEAETLSGGRTCQIIDDRFDEVIPTLIVTNNLYIKLMHTIVMKIVWEILHIFGLNLALDSIWEAIVDRQNFHVTKVVYNDDRGKTKYGERDVLALEAFNAMQYEAQEKLKNNDYNSDSMKCPLL